MVLGISRNVILVAFKFAIPALIACFLSGCLEDRTPEVIITGEKGGSAKATDSTGVEIVVRNARSPLNGAQISIEKGLLGVPSDTISISVLAQAPAPLRQEARAAGAIMVTPAVALSRASRSTFTLPIRVTLPYDKRVVGNEDFPQIIFWDEANMRYEAVQTVALDRTAGTVTFRTNHFTVFIGTMVPGLASALMGSRAYPNGFSKFRLDFDPAIDGFSIENFTTQTTAARDGACFGLVVYSQWYWWNKKNTDQKGLAAAYLNSTGGLVDDDLARELVNRLFVDTLDENVALVSSLRSSPRNGAITPLNVDLKTAVDTLSNLMVVGSPQVIGIFGKKTFDIVQGDPGHAVLAYGFDATSPTGQPSILIYDPNYPGVSKSIGWRYSDYSMETYDDTFNMMYANAATSFLLPEDLLRQYSIAKAGWPANERAFNSLSVNGVSGTSGEMAISETGNTLLSFLWTADETAGASNSYVHIFLDERAVGVRPISPNGTATFEFDPSGYALPVNLVAIISKNRTVSTDQSVISNGYQGFLRMQLRPAQKHILWMSVHPTASDVPLNAPYTQAQNFIVSAPSGLQCGVDPRTSECHKSFPDGQLVELTTLLGSSDTPVQWTGCDSVTPDNLLCTVTMTGDKQVTASFPYMFAGASSCTTYFEDYIDPPRNQLSQKVGVTGRVGDGVFVSGQEILSIDCGSWAKSGISCTRPPSAPASTEIIGTVAGCTQCELHIWKDTMAYHLTAVSIGSPNFCGPVSISVSQ